MPSPEEEAKAAHIRTLVEAGTDLAGRVPGAVIGFVLGGPVGGAIGAGAGYLINTSLKNVGADIELRMLGPREHMRIGAAWSYAAQRVYQLLMVDREDPRDDGFFEATDRGSRSPCDELVEGVLLAAAKEYEERKVPYLGYMVGNIAFTAGIDRALAARLIREAEELTYRQLCILSLIAQKDDYEWPDENAYNDQTRVTGWEQWGARRDYERAGQDRLGLYGGRVEQNPNMHVIGLPKFWLSPGKQKLTNDGRLTYGLMGLERMPKDDLQSVFEQLTPGPETAMSPETGHSAEQNDDR